jgi:citrate lyase subunit beta / citryl-CoA lyase
MRPRRSVLYMPGINERAMDKARSLPADCIILDLEDAVAPASKDIARETIAKTLVDGGYGNREVLVRVNSADTPWHESDLAMAMKSSAHGIVLPKIESPDAVAQVESALRETGASKRLWAMIETPVGVLNAAFIAAASDALDCLLMGTTDLANELRLPDKSAIAGLTWSLGSTVVAARAHGLDVIDGVHLDLQDASGFGQACQRARAFGFDGKSLIHPKQIAAANDVFAPDSSALDRAHRTIEAYREAESAGTGVAVLDGKLVEALHVTQSERTIALAQAIANLASD